MGNADQVRGPLEAALATRGGHVDDRQPGEQAGHRVSTASQTLDPGVQGGQDS